MNGSSDLSQSPEYMSFRSYIPLKRIVVDTDNNKGWRIYDCGPKNVRCPLICLPPVSGTADVFFKQALELSAKGVRVICAEAPVYWNVREWCEGFKKLLDYLDLDKVHVFGCSLGGYLAQKFAEYTVNCCRVASLILCNTFTDTSIFNNHEAATIFWILPALVLKRMLMGNFASTKVDPATVYAIDFMVERLESLPQTVLASRLTLNCLRGYVEAHKLSETPTTIIDVFDDCALSSDTREELYKSYPHAKLAHLKTGGNFPYLSRCGEVNLHLQDFGVAEEMLDLIPLHCATKDRDIFEDANKLVSNCGDLTNVPVLPLMEPELRFLLGNLKIEIFEAKAKKNMKIKECRHSWSESCRNSSSGLLDHGPKVIFRPDVPSTTAVDILRKIVELTTSRIKEA